MAKETVSREFKEQNGFVPEKIAKTMALFYEQIDALAAKVEENFEAHGACARCRPGCCACCIDDLTITQAEAAVIAAQYPNVLNEAPHAPGMCAFLDDDGLCRIYRARPIKCRTFGLAYRWQDEDESGEAYEMRGICELRQNDVDLETCDASCFIAPLVMDMRLGMMEKLTFGEEKRIALRSLFGK